MLKACKLALICLISLLSVLIFPVKTYAAKFTTSRFDVDAVIELDRTVLVTETISVDFIEPQRGLMRLIPGRTQTSGETGNRQERDVNLRLLGVERSEAGTFVPEPARAETVGGDWQIKVGRADVTHLGPATYRIRYSIAGALTDIDGKDAFGQRTELFWNLIPLGWSTAIEASNLTVHFPKLSRADVMARVLVGPRGTRTGAQFRLNKPFVGRSDLVQGTITNQTLDVQTQAPMSKGVGVTVILALPKGTVPPGKILRVIPTNTSSAEPSSAPTSIQPPSPFIIALPLLLLAGLYGLVKKHFAPPAGPLVVRFDPPEGVSASDCGFLMDARVDSRDIVAGIVTLAQKGALKLRHPVKDAYGNQTAQGLVIEIGNLFAAQDTTPFEQELFGYLAQYGSLVSADDLKGSFAPYYRALSFGLVQHAYEAGFYQEVTGRKGAYTLGWLVGVIAMVALIFSYAGITAIFGGLITFFIGSAFIGKISPLTIKGAKTRSWLSGLKEFISRANEKQLNYMADRSPDQAMFERLLPYAISFGLVKQWTQAFDGIDLQIPDWYVADSGMDTLWTLMFIDQFTDFDRSFSGPDIAGPSNDFSGPSSFGSGDGFSSGDSGFGSSGDSTSDSGGFDSGSGGFDSGGSSGDGGGGGGGDSW